MRKKHPEHVNLERWLVSYADFITLLFAFFVVMYAISQADISKFKKVAASLREAFSASGPVGMIDLGGTGGGDKVTSLQSETVPGGRVVDLPAGKTNTASDPDGELVRLKERLEETISLEMGLTEVSDHLQMQFDSRGLVLRLAVKDFFAPGEIDVKQDFRPMLDRIGRIVTATDHLVRIEGHTDISEKNTPGFPSDWELSAARAAWVAKYWIGKFDIDPARIGIAGYGHYRPLTESTDAWQRSKNRRVEIIVLNQKFEAPKKAGTE